MFFFLLLFNLVLLPFLQVSSKSKIYFLAVGQETNSKNIFYVTFIFEKYGKNYLLYKVHMISKNNLILKKKKN
jgi:hypothetical protein